MTARPEFGHGEIAHLAYLNWQTDGCPSGRDLQYWLEAECQLKATWHLLKAAFAAGAAAEAVIQARTRELAREFAGEQLQPIIFAAQLGVREAA